MFKLWETNLSFSWDMNMCMLWTDADVEKPQAKKRKTEDSGSAKNTQNGKKRKREDENEVRFWFIEQLSQWKLFWKIE